MEETYLSWTIETNKDWITVAPTAGTGNMPLTVHIESATSAIETDLEGIITITCTDCSPGQSKIVKVRRCKPAECEYESSGTVQYYDAGTIYVGKCAGSTGFTLHYTTTYQSTNGCNPKVENGREEIRYSWDNNETNSQKELINVPGKYKIIQEAGPCSCSCRNIKFTTDTYLVWDWDDITERVVTFDIDTQCIGSLSVTSVTVSDGFIASLNGNSIIVKPSGKNTSTSSSKTGNVSINYFSDYSETCYGVISLTQKSQGCNCDTLSLNKDSVNVNIGSVETVTVIPGCATNISVTSSDSGKATVTYSNGKITITGISSGATTITVAYTAGNNPDCKKQITVNVGCPQINITHTPESLTCNGGDMQFHIN